MSTSLNSTLLFGQQLSGPSRLPGSAAGGAEVVVHDPARQLALVLGAEGVDFLDIASGARVGGFGKAAVQGTGGDPLTRLGTANSLAISGDTLAVSFDGGLSAGAGSAHLVNGYVAFFALASGPDGAVTATWQRTVTSNAFSVPDQIAFTPDGARLLVAVEGEPRDEYATGVNGDGSAGDRNPEGGVAIVEVATGNLTFVGFRPLLDTAEEREALLGAGLRANIPVPEVTEDSLARDLEPEYIAVAPGGRFAYVAIQEGNAIAELDLDARAFTRILPLGWKDHSLPGNGIDPSDRDGPGNTNIRQIEQVPVRGLYMPDGLATFERDGRTFLVTANEGDAREWAIMGPAGRDDPRLNGSGLALDPAVFPDAATLLLNSELGRLRVSRTDGDEDGDGDLDAIYAFGARSLSIWEVTPDGLVRTYDSGDLIDRTLFEQFPTLAAPDRDPAKGAEPESVSLGFVDGVLHAFVALERASAGNSLVMAFRVEDQDSVAYAGLIRTTGTGDQNPEVIAFVPREGAPASVDAPLLLIPNEVSGNVRATTVTNPASAPFTLQILHASDFEGGVEAVARAPNFAAIVDFLEDQAPNSITLSSGDNFIPGPFTAAGTDPSVRDELAAFYEQALGLAPGSLTGIRAGTLPFNALDVAILNAIGVEASAIGNHEFDLGPNPFAGAFDFTATLPSLPAQPTLGAITNIGAQFPYLSANLNAAGEPALNPLFEAALRPALSYATTAGDLASGANIRAEATGREWSPWTTITEGGQTIGVLGATTQILSAISSVGGVTNTAGNQDDMAALAAVLQPFVDQMTAQGINKIVLLSHLQQNALEQRLATLLAGVDVIVAGGSHQLFANPGDPLEPGTTPGNPYPLVREGADGAPVLVVNTGANYTNVGRLTVTFDANGVIDLAALPGTVAARATGSYETTDAGVDRLLGDGDGTLSDAERAAIFADGTRGGEVLQLVTPVGEVIETKDGNVLGFTDVFLEGRRNLVRTEETNLGNLTADANLWIARQADPLAVVSIKNGGGVRAEIGAVVGQPVPELLPPQPRPGTDEPEGQISQLDIENSLRFNNALSLATVTRQGLLNLVENALAGAAPGQTPGSFPQIGGLAFSWDPSRPALDRVKSLAIVDQSTGAVRDVVARDFGLVGSAAQTVRLVTLNFLLPPDGAAAGGGDRIFVRGDVVDATSTGALVADRLAVYTDVASLDRVDLGALVDPGRASFAPAGSEQDALAEYLREFHATADAAFDAAETPRSGDLRIQNLAFRADALDAPVVEITTGGVTGSFFSTALPAGGAQQFRFDGTAGDDRILFPGATNGEINAGGGDDEVFGGGGDDLLRGGEGDDELNGGDGADLLGGGDGADALAGGGADDILLGEDGRDLLLGGAGDDTLIGGRGPDEMQGGAGDDTYQVDNLLDVVEETAGEGSDSVVVLANGWTAATDVENVFLQGSATLVFGSESGDVITANTLSSRVFGNGGGDQLWGQGGDDELHGGAGRDVLRGQGGDDVLVGGAGNDQLVGGGEADRFVFDAPGWGRDELFDFGRAEGDRIDMRGSGLSFADLTIEVIGTTTRMTFEGDRVDFYGLPGGLTAADFLFA